MYMSTHMFVYVSLCYVVALALTATSWSYSMVTPLLWTTAVALVLKVWKDSLEEGEKFWPVNKAFDRFREMRMYAHVATAVLVAVALVLFQIEAYKTEWSSRTVPTAWRVILYSIAAVYGASTVPSLLALTQDKLWGAVLNKKQRISILVIRELITVGFAIPLIYNIVDIVDNGDDSEWRHLAASLVFTRAVIYFIIFWYIVPDWGADSPLENDKILSEICRGSGMLILYVVVIRRLHENRLLTDMGFVSERDTVASIIGFLSLLSGYLILLNTEDKNGVVPTVAIVSILISIIILVLIVFGSMQ